MGIRKSLEELLSIVFIIINIIFINIIYSVSRVLTLREMRDKTVDLSLVREMRKKINIIRPERQIIIIITGYHSIQ